MCPTKSYHEQRNVTLANTSVENQIAIFEVTIKYINSIDLEKINHSNEQM